jgi:arabinosaccharide transport system substrate-binding protein
MFLNAAPDVPLRPSSPYYVKALTYLGNVAHQLATLAEERNTANPARLESDARRLLDEAQRGLTRQMRRNVFLASPRR